jgi:hypothetical protein
MAPFKIFFSLIELISFLFEFQNLLTQAVAATLADIVNDEKVAKSKHKFEALVSFIKQTSRFGPCTGPSSGLSLLVGGDVDIFYKADDMFRPL